MKLLAGSTLLGLTLIAVVLDKSLHTVAWQVHKLAENGWLRLRPSPTGLEPLIWVFMALAIALLVWGFWEAYRQTKQ